MGISIDQMVGEQFKPTKEELDILSDTRFLMLKESLAKKVISRLAGIEHEIKIQLKESAFNFPENALIQAGKISRGENYNGLPYFVLDFPRLFTQKSIFTFRTMLWWGNEFSCTMHLSGDALSMINEQCLTQIKEQQDLYFCVNRSPWEYHFGKDNYVPASTLDIGEMTEHIHQHKFMKISRHIPVQKWDEFEAFTLGSFAQYLLLLKS
ncbi:hypothetical protein [Marinoscillum sp. MHG1-6]|uniref:hypothetical protein n=1 Tax=Marinoscillum sp. MHG1-6 TaxID=2959627 RepID=UPI002157F4A3|nr:hypothetical protein [Marinoscillum sp. MHG1-6]